MTDTPDKYDREEWTKAFLAAQKELPDIPKTKTAKIPTKNGGEYSYKYADLPDVLSIARPILNKHGLSVTQSVAGDPNSVAVTTRIYHEAGHVEEFGPLVLPSGGDARAAGSAVTYARRYGLTAALGIASDEDDDGAQARRPQPQPEASYPKLTNRLKAVAAEVAPNVQAAQELFDRVVGDTAVTPETADALEAALRDEAPF